MPSGSASYPVGADALAGTATLIKTGAVSLSGYHIFNTTAASAYVQLYDAATASSVTVGTTVHTLVLGIPASSGACRSLSRPLKFTNGIVAASTTAVAGATGAIVAVEFDISD